MTTPLTEQLTVHGHLYLLAHDRDRNRVALNRHWLLGFALRAAMMTDLTLAGYLHDVDGKAHRSGTKFPSEPLLSEMLGMVDQLTEQGPAPVRALTRAVKAICRELAIDGLTSLLAGGCGGCGGCGG
ncbi:GPP34 family phosphoprotein [Mycobacterium sp. C31M]